MNLNLSLETILLISGAALLGMGLGVLITATIIRKSLLKKGKKIINDAEVQANALKDKKMLEAKERYLQLKADYEQYSNEKNRQITLADGRTKQKEQATSQKLEQVQRKEKEVEHLKNNLNEQQKALNKKTE
jgi:ribonucrease Y